MFHIIVSQIASGHLPVHVPWSWPHHFVTSHLLRGGAFVTS